MATQEKAKIAMQTTLNAVKAIRCHSKLSEEHRDELRKTRSTIMRAIFEATEVSTPTAFVVLKKQWPAGAEEEARVELTLLKEDGTGFAVEGKAVDEAKDRYEEQDLAESLCAGTGAKAANCSPSAIAEVAGACAELVVGEEMWLYLIDELTGKPVVPEEDDAIYPIRIVTRRRSRFEALAGHAGRPHAASLVNGVSGVVRLFGYPCPSSRARGARARKTRSTC